MSQESIHVEVPDDHTNSGQNKEMNNEAVNILDLSRGERLAPPNDAKEPDSPTETMKHVKEPEKSNDEVKIDIENVKAKASLMQKKSVKEVLLIDIYGVDKPESGYNSTVPIDRPRVQGERQTRRFRNKVFTFFMNPSQGGEGGGLDYANGDPATRNIFVQKVFSLVLIMLLITALLVWLVYNSDSPRHYFRSRSIQIPVLFASVVLMFLSCIIPSDCARIPPCNYVCLMLAVLCMTFICAAITCRYAAISVILALLVTALVVMMCLALAFTQFDFTQFLIFVLAGMAVLALSMLIYLVLMLCGIYVPGMHMALLVISTLLQTFLLIIELQMILGGKAVEISEHDYALGAFLLYTSIMQLFLNILQIIGEVE